MKRNIVEVEIKKSANESVFFLRDRGIPYEMSVESLMEHIKNTHSRMVMFETIEEDKLLLKGYFMVNNEKTLLKQLRKAGKAQISF